LTSNGFYQIHIQLFATGDVRTVLYVLACSINRFICLVTTISLVSLAIILVGVMIFTGQISLYRVLVGLIIIVGDCYCVGLVIGINFRRIGLSFFFHGFGFFVDFWQRHACFATLSLSRRCFVVTIAARNTPTL
jgi:hypothetical protein